MKGWSPYVVGVGIGMLSWLTFLLSDKPLGVSTTFVRIVGLIEGLIHPDKIKTKKYYQENPPGVDWNLLFGIGIVVGSFIAAKLSGELQFVFIPGFWARQFGQSNFSRWLSAVGGGLLIGFGARWAGGCTSGHGISGTLQLAVISWLTFIFFFIGGAATAFILYS